MAVILITDSGCDLTLQQAKVLGVELVPMTVHFDGEEFRSGIDLTNDVFYEKLTASDTIPTTSQPTPHQFESVYRKVRESGNQAVVVCVSSALSGTYQSACIALDGFDDCIHVVDSQAVSIAQRILLDYAIHLREHGADAKAIAEALNTKKLDVCIYGAVDSLTYLIKGGRLSKAAGTVGSLLGIKPVLTLSEGALIVAGKARGPKAAITMTHNLIKTASVDQNMPFGVGYTGTDPSVAEIFLETVGGEFAGKDTPVYQVGSTVGTHAGPGLYLAAFFKKSF